MDKIQATGEALRKLAIDVDYNATSTIAGTALSILKRGNISADNIYDLLQALAKIGRPLNASEKLGMVSPYLNPVTSSAAVVRGLARSYQNGSLDLLDEPPKPTLVNWFFRLTHPSNTGGGRALRDWLIGFKITLSEIQQYYDYTAKDKADFAAGFIFGTAKSLTYDNVKGLYDLVGLGANVHLMITNYEAELIVRLALEYEKKANTNTLLAIQSAAKLQDTLQQILLNGKSVSIYREATAVGSFLAEIKALFLDFCINPFLKFVDDEAFQKFDLIATQINTFVDKEQEEYRKAAWIWDYAHSKFEKELERKVYPYLMEYRMLEAGIAAGNLLTDIAQLLIGIFMLLLGAGKLLVKGGKLAVAKLLTLPVADKAKAMVMLSAISIDLNYLTKVSPHTIDSPAIVLALEADELKKVSKALDEELPFFETRNVKILDAGAANSLSQSTGKPLALGCSSLGGDPMYLLSILGMLSMLRRRGKGRPLTDAEIREIKDHFTEDFAFKYIESLKKTPRPNFNHFLKTIAQRNGIKMPPGAAKEEIISLIVEELVKQFETDGVKGLNRKGVYSSFNSFMNRELRVVSRLKDYEGMVIIIDERLDHLLNTVLDPRSFARLKDTSVRLEDVFNMTIEQFYQKFYPDKKMSDMYRLYVEKIKNTDARGLYERREQLLDMLETGKGNTEELLKEYDSLADKIIVKIQKLIDQKKISEGDRDMIFKYVFGKLRIRGKCGAARPDFAIIDLLEGIEVYDFLHTANKKAIDRSHLIGSEFYQDFLRVVFGDIVPENKVAIDVLYSFSEEIRKRLR
jgi:hypothetical protein